MHLKYFRDVFNQLKIDKNFEIWRNLETQLEQAKLELNLANNRKNEAEQSEKELRNEVGELRITGI